MNKEETTVLTIDKALHIKKSKSLESIELPFVKEILDILLFLVQHHQ